jgi:hypothetical protein
VQVTTALEFVTPTASCGRFRFTAIPVAWTLDPGWAQAAWRFLRLGFRHIPDGPDHLLFLLCLVIPFRRLRPLVWIVTAFTLAHSITLIGAASGWRRRALVSRADRDADRRHDRLHRDRKHRSPRPASAAGGCSPSGSGSSTGSVSRWRSRSRCSSPARACSPRSLPSMSGSSSDNLSSSPSGTGAQFPVPVRRGGAQGAIIISALIAHAGWHWMTDRAAALGRYDPEWSAALRWTPIAVLVLAAGWLAFRRHRQRG